jgi:hypothetical protein
MEEIEQFGLYLCTVEPRPSFKGAILKDEAKRMAGKCFILQAYWLQDENDPYPGEWALGDNHELGRYEDFDLAWISSGDVRIVRLVDSNGEGKL